MAELRHILELRGPSAPPNVPLSNLEAHGYLCQGDLEKALEYVRIARSFPSISCSATPLYQMGQYEEARDLDHPIETFTTATGII
jgi:hypothetical protein